MAKPNLIGGMAELEVMFAQLERVPQSIATRASRKGASVALRAAKSNAPVDEGELKRGLIMKQERRRVSGRTVFQVMPSQYLNDVYVKTSKAGKRSYYPASIEYGFLTVDGGYVPGQRYLRRAADDNLTEIERVILDETAKGVDKALRKRK